MSMVADRVSVAASRKCTLWAVLAVTIRLGPPGRLLRSSITPPSWSLPGLTRQSIIFARRWMRRSRGRLRLFPRTTIEKSLHLDRKQLLRRDDARRKALLVHETADRLPGRTVGLDPIGPEILTEYASSPRRGRSATAGQDAARRCRRGRRRRSPWP